MTVLSMTDPVNGTTADATLIAANNAAVKAVVNGNIDNANVVAGANIDAAKLLDGTVTNAKLVASAGTLANMPPGRELTYNEFTSPVTASATTEATATTIVSASAFTFDGTTPVFIEFYAPRSLSGDNPGNGPTFYLYDGASSIGLIGQQSTPSAAQLTGPISLRRRLTPSAAAHTYGIRAAAPAGGTAAPVITAGAGGVGAFMPGFIRIVKV